MERNCEEPQENPTWRAMNVSSPPVPSGKRQQSCSETLLLNFIKGLALIYGVASLATIPFWVSSWQAYSDHGETGLEEQAWQAVLLTSTLYHIERCKPGHSNTLIGEDGFLLIDCLIQVLIIVGCVILDHQSFKVKQLEKGLDIEDYSLELTLVPCVPAYVVLPEIRNHLEGQLAKAFDLPNKEIILNMWSANLQLRNRLKHLDKQLGSVKRQIEQNIERDQTKLWIEERRRLERQISQIRNVEAANEDIVWITFESRELRYLALREFQKGLLIFGKPLKLAKAPHPRQIIWADLHCSKLSRLLTRLGSTLLCTILILGFNLLILLTRRAESLMSSSILILALELILKEAIVLVSGRQIHRRQSRSDQSLFLKLTKYLYISSGLIVFFSSYDYGDNGFARTFSLRQFKAASPRWFQIVGLNILITFILQIVYVNLRPSLQRLKETLFVTTYNKLCKASRKVRFESDINLCYAQLVSVLLIANTYSSTHPVLYPLSSILCLAAYFSHRRHLSCSLAAPYNADTLNASAIQILHLSIAFHFMMVFLCFGRNWALVISIVMGGCVFMFNVLVNPVISLIRSRLGPFCFSKFTPKSAMTLSSMLHSQQIRDIQQDMDQNIKMCREAYYLQNPTQQYTQWGYLQRHEDWVQGQKQKLGRAPGESSVVRGPVTYSIKCVAQKRECCSI